MLRLPQIPRLHLAVVFDSRDLLVSMLAGRGRIVGEYFFSADAPHRYAAVIECHNEATGRQLRSRLPYGTDAMLSHSEALLHVFALGAKTSPAAAAA